MNWLKWTNLHRIAVFKVVLAIRSPSGDPASPSSKCEDPGLSPHILVLISIFFLPLRIAQNCNVCFHFLPLLYPARRGITHRGPLPRRSHQHLSAELMDETGWCRYHLFNKHTLTWPQWGNSTKGNVRNMSHRHASCPIIYPKTPTETSDQSGRISSSADPFSVNARRVAGSWTLPLAIRFIERLMNQTLCSSPHVI